MSHPNHRSSGAVISNSLQEGLRRLIMELHGLSDMLPENDAPIDMILMRRLPNEVICTNPETGCFKRVSTRRRGLCPECEQPIVHFRTITEG